MFKTSPYISALRHKLKLWHFINLKVILKIYINPSPKNLALHLNRSFKI
jgi:hypothetical protein